MSSFNFLSSPIQLPQASSDQSRTRLATTLGYNVNAASIANNLAVLEEERRASKAQEAQAQTANTEHNYYLGVTLALGELGNASTGLSDPTVSGPQALQSNVNGFVDAYNQVITQVQQANTSDGAVGDVTTQALQQSLSNVIAAPQLSAAGSFNSVAQLGVTQNADGTLSVDQTQLTGAIAADAASVQSIFQTDASTRAPGLADQVRELSQAYQTPTPSTDTIAAQVAQRLAPGTAQQLLSSYSAQQFAPALQSGYLAYQGGIDILRAQSTLLNQLSLSSIRPAGGGAGI